LISFRLKKLVSSQIARLHEAISELTVAVKAISSRLDNMSTCPNAVTADTHLNTEYDNNVKVPSAEFSPTPSSVSTLKSSVSSFVASHNVLPVASHNVLPVTSFTTSHVAVPVTSTNATLPVSIPFNSSDVLPMVMPSISPDASHSLLVAPRLEGPQLTEAVMEAFKKRHWYCITKGIQTGVFQSW
jgi:hypothetical protein